MLTHDKFGKLRLADFAPVTRIRELSDWEFLGRLWVGEAIGFSEWLRPKNRKTVLESLALDIAELPEQIVSSVLAQIGLPFRSGMKRTDLVKLLGDPVETHVFAEDRKTYDFRYGKSEPYVISCTVLNRGGLTYLVVTTQRGKASPTTRSSGRSKTRAAKRKR